MKIRGCNLDVDILEELQEFDWHNDVIKGSKFIACSPFRTERHPSFAVNLETGTFKDSGNSDDYYRQGNLVKLLSILRNEDIAFIEDYLIEKYAIILRDTDTLQLQLNLQGDQIKPLFINRTNIQHLYKQRTDYLSKRGISIEIQKLFEIGFNPQNGCVALLWTDKKGNIINIKYRRTDVKSFFYEKGGQPIKNYVYGLYQCVQVKAKRIFICESEIDALTFWTYGFPAVAVGGSSLSDSQKNLLLTSGIEEIAIATDNDSVGQNFRQLLIREFGGVLTVTRFVFPNKVKDVNEMTGEQIVESVKSLEKPSFSFLNLS